MQLGLFGGTFDPIHVGHLILAESCRETLGLDRVWFVVAGSPPHKAGGRTAVAHRVEMVRLAIAGNLGFEVSEVEARTPGPHYSVETLEQVRRDRPDDELSFLIGADSLVDLPHWREPARIMELARLVVVNRPGFSPPPFDPPPGARPIVHVDVPPIGIASHAIRRCLREGRSVRYQVPHAVKAYIDAHGLYPAEEPNR